MIAVDTMAATDEARDLVEAAARYLRDQWPIGSAIGIDGIPESAVRSLWKGAAELGWAWVAKRDTPGSALAPAPELAALFATLGRHPAPIPLAELAVWLPVISAFDERQALLEFLDGDRLLGFGVRSNEGSSDVWSGTTYDGSRVTGSKAPVAAGLSADAFVVSAQSAQGPSLVLVERDQPGVELAPMRCYDLLDTPATLDLTDARATTLATGGDAEQIVLTAMTLERAATAAELSALAASSIRMAVEYAGERVQFGRPIGSFQAIKHLLAEAWIDVYAAECVARSASRQIPLADAAEARRQADSALSFAIGAARRATESALQAHGGIGFVLDYHLSRYFNRAISRSAVAGSPQELLLALGRSAVANTSAGQP